MHRRERWYHQRDNNRLVRPFEWGLEYIVDHVNGDDPRELFRKHTAQVIPASEDFYALPPDTDYHLDDDQLPWTSAVRTPCAENDIAHGRFFPAKIKNGKRSRKAVVVLPQWNAQPESHVEACRIFNMIGMSALRLTLPYHQRRKPPELERADHLVSSNIGRTIQSVRQAVLDTRAAVQWLKAEGYERVGILGTSIGSCVAFLTFAHEPDLNAGAFNHVSGYVADVVWNGISTAHVRAGFGDRLPWTSCVVTGRRLVRCHSCRAWRRWVIDRYGLSWRATISRSRSIFHVQRLTKRDGTTCRSMSCGFLAATTLPRRCRGRPSTPGRSPPFSESSLAADERG